MNSLSSYPYNPNMFNLQPTATNAINSNPNPSPSLSREQREKMIGTTFTVELNDSIQLPNYLNNSAGQPIDLNQFHHTNSRNNTLPPSFTSVGQNISVNLNGNVLRGVIFDDNVAVNIKPVNLAANNPIPQLQPAIPNITNQIPNLTYFAAPPPPRV
jgi:hypothetical protein